MKTSLPPSKKVFPKIAFIGLLSMLIMWLLFCFNTLYAAGYPASKFKSRHVKGSAKNGITFKGANQIAVPSITYSNPINYVANTAITPITPLSSGVAALSYSTSAAATGSGFTNPAGVAVDKNGNIYVADYGNGAIKKIAAVGGATTVFHSGFAHPFGVAVDTAGNVFVTDASSSVLYKIFKSDNSVATIGAGTITNPAGIAVDMAGNVYLADHGNSIIYKIAAGSTTPVAIGTGFYNPYGVAVDKAGNVYVADRNNKAIKKIQAADGATVTVASGFTDPVGVAVDGAGNIYEADNVDNVIKMIPVGGTQVTIGTGFSTPYGVVADASTGNVYVADFGNNAIKEIQPVGGYFITPALPAGLNFDNNTGIITGTPTVVSPLTTYTVTAYNSSGSTTALVKINVLPLSFGYPASPVTYAAGVPASNITPGSIGVAAPGYGTPASIGSGFSGPHHVAVDAGGNIYVSDYINNVVKKIPAGGGAAITIGSGFLNPTGVAVDGAGNVYVADYGHNLVKKIPFGSNIPVTIGTGFNHPQGIAVDAAQNVYVADNGTGFVKEILASTGVIINVGSNYSAPLGVAVDAVGNIYIGTTGTGSIKMVPFNGGPTVSLGSGFNNAYGVAINIAGDVYVADQTNNAAKEIPAGSNTVLTLSSAFNQPTGIAVDIAGNIYVADYLNSAVKKMVPVGGYYINALPAGLIFNTTTGVITGKPTTPVAATNYTVTGYNALGSNAGVVNITVMLPAPPTVSYAATQSYVINTAITPQHPTTGGVVSDFGYSVNPLVISAALNKPNSIAIDATGNIYVSSSGSSVQKVPAGGGAPVYVGMGFINPSGIAIDAAGNIYIGDYTNNAIKKIPTGGGAPVSIGTGFNGPTGVAVDAAGNVYVADFNNNAVKEILVAGGSTITLGSGFNHPNAVAVDAAGNVYVADSFNGMVKKIPVGGGTIVTLASGMKGPYGIAVDVGGNVFVAERDANAVDEIPVGGGAMFQIGGGFSSPYGVTIDAAGNIYVADYFNNSAKEIKLVGGFYINPALPAGLSFDNSTGFISGTPTAVSPATNYIITDFNVGGSGSVTVNITVNQYPAPGISYSSPKTYLLNTAIATLTPTNSGGPVSAPAYSNSTVALGTGFSLPTSVAVDVAGNIYVADRSNNAVKKILAVDGSTVVIGSGFNSPAGVAVDAAGNVYVGDEGNNAVKMIPVGGGAIVTLGSGFSAPFGVAVDAAGNIYVADEGHNAVKKIPFGSNVPVVIGSGLVTPTDVKVDALGNLYVADYGNNLVKMLPAGGSAFVTIGTGFNQPTGMAVDASGDVYIADYQNNAVKEIPAGSNTPVVIGSGFSHPFGVAVDGAGNVFVADYLASMVKKIAPVGGYYINTGLPAGLIFNTTTGVISGTPTAASPATNYKVTAYNTTGSGTATVNIKTVASSNNAALANLVISTGTLSPAFATATSSYTASVANATASIKIVPTASDAGAAIKVNGVTVASGTSSASLPLALGSNTITTVVTASDGTTAKTYTLTVTRLSGTLSTNALLSIVALTPASSLATVTGPGYKNYTTSVPNSETSVQVTSIAQDATATIKVNGTAVASGTASQAIPLNVGSNVINVIVTAQDGTTTKTYIITATRAVSSNAALVNLAISAGTLSPVFAAATSSYTASVPNATTGLTLTPTTSDAGATVKVNGVAVTSGTASANLPLAVGTNTIATVVTASDGTTTKTYTLTVTRAASGLSTNALLSIVALTPASSLAVVTGPGYKNYTTSVPNSETSVQVTSIAQDATATIKVNGTAVASGTASQAIPLNVGSNVINIIVTAQDGTTTKTYIITATRAVSSNAALANLAISAGTLSPVFAAATSSYTASVPNATTGLTLTPTTSDAGATVKVNGVAVTSGTASANLPLVIGTNTITTVVTASDGTTTKTYTLTVTRAASGLSTNALLSIVALTPASSLAVVTGPGYKNYTTSVPNSETSVQVTSIAQDATATIKVNGTAVASGTASQSIPLNVGSNVINVIVTAQDGITTKTYIITATRAMASMDAQYIENPDDTIKVADDGILVHSAVSPNGDGKNDVLTIDGLAKYPDNKLTIMNKAGIEIYQVSGYDNVNKVFDGHSNKTMAMQKPGTYFYQLEYNDQGKSKYKTGYILLKY